MAHISMNNKSATKFKMVQLDDRLRFYNFLKENENVVPCSLYVNKDDGTIYFVEQENINNNIESI